MAKKVEIVFCRTKLASCVSEARGSRALLAADGNYRQLLDDRVPIDRDLAPVERGPASTRILLPGAFPKVSSGTDVCRLLIRSISPVSRIIYPPTGRNLTLKNVPSRAQGTCSVIERTQSYFGLYMAHSRGPRGVYPWAEGMYYTSDV